MRYVAAGGRLRLVTSATEADHEAAQADIPSGQNMPLAGLQSLPPSRIASPRPQSSGLVVDHIIYVRYSRETEPMQVDTA